MKEKWSHLMKKDGAKTVAASVISILIGLLVGCVIVIITGLTSGNMDGGSVWDGVRLVLGGILSTGRDASGSLTFGFNPTNVGNMLFRATPLILTGLSVAVAFKTGLFNIGAPGQYLMGTAATLITALSIPTSVVPSPIVWLLAFLAGVLAGALWGAIPGLVKALLNINEVLACIMTNWIAANLVTWIFENSVWCNLEEYGKTNYIYKTTHNGVETARAGLDALFPGSQVNWGIGVAVIIAVLVYVLMTKTTLGYELVACGANRHAAHYAGINDKRNIVLSMAIAGALSGAGAALYWLAGNTEFYWQTYQSLPATGFNGIPVALLASCSPIGCIFSGMFMAYLTISGNQLSTFTAYNEYIANIIIAVIVYLSAFTLFFKGLMSKRKNAAPARSGEAEKTAETAGEEMKQK